MTRFAAGTKVPVAQSRAEIERTLERFGASAFGYTSEPGKARIAFRYGKGDDMRHVRFDLPLPKQSAFKSQDRFEVALREAWRALVLCIKAKLSSVESGIESFEEAFWAHVVTEDGRTIYERTREPLALTYRDGKPRPLLIGPQ